MNSKEQAKEMYLNDGYTKKQIADTVGVDERTIYRWIKQEQWQSLKEATLNAPAVMVNHLYSQMVELQNKIAAREEGDRIPTMQEVEVTRKLLNCIDKLGVSNSLSANMQMIMNFTDYLRQSDLPFAQKMVVYANKYLFDKSNREYIPYHFLHTAARPRVDQDTVDKLKPEEERAAAPEPVAEPAAATQAVEVPAEPPILGDDLLDNPCLPTWADVDHDFPPSLDSGLIWQGHGRVFSYSDDEPRKMSLEEAIQFARIGYNVEWYKYNDTTLNQVATSTQMSGKTFVSHAGTPNAMPSKSLSGSASQPNDNSASPSSQPDISRHLDSVSALSVTTKNNPPPSKLIKKGQVYSRPVTITRKPF